MKIFIVTATDVDGVIRILGASVDQVEAEKFVYAYNLGNPSSGQAIIRTLSDLKMPSAWSD